MRHRIPLVAVIFVDNAFGNVRRIQQEQFGNRLIACDLANPDFVKYAKLRRQRPARAARTSCGWRSGKPSRAANRL
jgi:acetolactate synthase-1/2/3 large subunit